MAERLAQAKKMTALKDHLTRLFNRIQNILVQDEVNKNELIDLKETLYDRRDILVSEIYTYLDELDGSKEDMLENEKQIEVIDDKIESIVNEINIFLKKTGKEVKQKRYLKVNKISAS